jgi:hypothetical protein
LSRDDFNLQNSFSTNAYGSRKNHNGEFFINLLSPLQRQKSDLIVLFLQDNVDFSLLILQDFIIRARLGFQQSPSKNDRPNIVIFDELLKQEVAITVTVLKSRQSFFQ